MQASYLYAPKVNAASLMSLGPINMANKSRHVNSGACDKRRKKNLRKQRMIERQIRKTQKGTHGKSKVMGKPKEKTRSK